jgi:tripartite-type tricarboxylate transporter receptor subunit TctC
VADLTARAVGQKLSESLGQAVVIDNKPSAGGVVSGDAVAKADAVGHTQLLMSNGTAGARGCLNRCRFMRSAILLRFRCWAILTLRLWSIKTTHLKSSAGIDAQIVPFYGKPAVTTALRGGSVDVAVEILGS